jgi:hypothetical protein
LNTTLTPHSIIHGDACFAYFNKIWGIPIILLVRHVGATSAERTLSAVRMLVMGVALRARARC